MEKNYIIIDSQIDLFDTESKELIKFIRKQNINTFTMSLKHIVRKKTNILKYNNPLFIIANCDFIEKYFEYFYNIQINNNDYPESLKNYLFRNICIMTYHEAKKISSIKSIFIKPYNNTKKFTGKVISCYDNKVSFSIKKNVYVSDVVHFITEYRYFIIDNMISDKRNYYGN